MTRDAASALRNRRQAANVPTARQAATTGRPSDLVVTADMIPDPLEVEAAGDLNGTEKHDLGLCERAVENLSTARWLAGKGLQSIRDRKLYRQTHSTFEAYVEDRWEMSERAAYQLIEEWPLAERLQHALGKPATPSHTRALLPVAHRFGLAPAVDLYQQIIPRAETDGVRLTAALTTRVVKAVLAQTGAQAQIPQFQEAARQLMNAHALPALEPPRTPPAAPMPASPATSHNPGPAEVAEDSADEAETVTAERDLQNFAGHHEKVTTVGVIVPRLPSAPGDLPDTLSPEETLVYLRAILQRAREIEAAIDSLVGVDPFQKGEAEDLRREIYRRLRRAAEPYRPYDPGRHGS